MNNMGGADGLPDEDEADDVRILFILHLSTLCSCREKVILKMLNLSITFEAFALIVFLLNFHCRMILQIVMMKVSIYEPL